MLVNAFIGQTFGRIGLTVKLMKRVFYLLFCFLCLSFMRSGKLQADVVDVLAIDYPPFTGEKLPGNGLSFRLLQAYAHKHMTVAVRPKFLPPARVQVLLSEGAWCLSFYPPKSNNEFAGFLQLSDQWVDLGLFRRAREDRFVWAALQDLSGGKIATFRTPTFGDLYSQFSQAGLELVYVDHLEQAFKLLINNRVDYVFADRFAPANVSYTQKYLTQLQFGETILTKTQVGFFYNKSCASKIFRAHL